MDNKQTLSLRLEGGLFELEVVGVGDVLEFDGVEQVFHVEFDFLADFVGLEGVGVVLLEQHFEGQDLVVDIVLTVADVLPGLHSAEVLVLPHFVVAVQQGEEVPVPFLAPLDLEPDESAVFGLGDLVEEEGQGFFGGDLVGSEVVEQALLPVDGCFFLELFVFVRNLKKQLAHFLLPVVFAVLLRKVVDLAPGGTLAAHHLLYHCEVVEVEGEHWQARLAHLVPVLLLEFALQAVGQGVGEEGLVGLRGQGGVGGRLLQGLQGGCFGLFYVVHRFIEYMEFGEGVGGRLDG